jgi:hypothetical protein
MAKEVAPPVQQMTREQAQLGWEVLEQFVTNANRRNYKLSLFGMTSADEPPVDLIKKSNDWSTFVSKSDCALYEVQALRVFNDKDEYLGHFLVTNEEANIKVPPECPTIEEFIEYTMNHYGKVAWFPPQSSPEQ